MATVTAPVAVAPALAVAGIEFVKDSKFSLKGEDQNGHANGYIYDSTENKMNGYENGYTNDVTKQKTSKWNLDANGRFKDYPGGKRRHNAHKILIDLY